MINLRNQQALTGIKNNEHFLTRTETVIFYLLLFSGLIPLFVNKYFVTLDGPSHLYNGFLIKSLISGEYPEINNLFRLNSFPVPNGISQFLFLIFGLFLPDFLTEKIVLFLYLFFTPFIFRKLILFLSPSNRVFSWFMILFVHNQNFYFGFFNLSFGILFFFLTILYFFKYGKELRNHHVFALAGLLLLTYFSHLLVFLISFFFLLFLTLSSVGISRIANRISFTGLKKATRKTLRIMLAALPALALTFLYLIKFESLENNPQRLDIKLLIEWILDIRPLLALRYGFPWKTYTLFFFIFLMVMTLTQMIPSLRGYSKKDNNSNKPTDNIRIATPVLILFTLGSLVLFLTIPNVILLSERLILFFFLFLITFLAIQKYPEWIHYTAAIILIVVHIAFTRMYTFTLAKYSKEVTHIKEAVRAIEPGEIVLPLNYNDKWIFMHISGYAGTGNPLALLENYEAGHTWFPVRWNSSPYQIGFLDKSDAENIILTCKKFVNKEAPDYFSLVSDGSIIKPILYVLVIKDPVNNDSLIPECVQQILDKSYSVQSINSFCTLYHLDQNNLLPASR